uniref:Hsp90like protein putative n=1 Tax=Albugo laibachii Nc14 TaxID=890382 RepID=F0WJ38_9STRA|nr:hsp90like protein putative [Albugo laibachii Nc14]CCA21657.1 hsp90like protein putative [Albugo laibachii Nc14]|eukprot:CCA21657.1 hsp90like protein putative [Albugo laibachii Nc14]
MTQTEGINAINQNDSSSNKMNLISKKRVDANDYSRFDNIDISDSEAEEEKPLEKKSEVKSKCRNCYNYGAKMKCSICKKAAYCNRKCQSSDWTFHKKTCRKPTPPKNDAREHGDPASARASPKEKEKSSTPRAETQKKTDNCALQEVVIDESDLGDARGYKNGLPYFHRELSVEDQKLLGDTAPKKMPIISGTDGSKHEGSAWNAAGTFEERNFIKWAEHRLSKILSSVKLTEGTIHGSIQAPLNLTGDASICVIRGRKRYLFDFSFELPFVLTVEGHHTYKGSYTMHDISNDGDFEISYGLEKNPQDEAVLNALSKFVGDSHSGLQQEVLRAIQEFAAEFEKQ